MTVSERFSPQSFEIVKKSISILLDIYTDVNEIVRRSGNSIRHTFAKEHKKVHISTETHTHTHTHTHYISSVLAH